MPGKGVLGRCAGKGIFAWRWCFESCALARVPGEEGRPRGQPVAAGWPGRGRMGSLGRKVGANPAPQSQDPETSREGRRPPALTGPARGSRAPTLTHRPVVAARVHLGQRGLSGRPHRRGGGPGRLAEDQRQQDERQLAAAHGPDGQLPGALSKPRSDRRTWTSGSSAVVRAAAAAFAKPRLYMGARSGGSGAPPPRTREL